MTFFGKLCNSSNKLTLGLNECNLKYLKPNIMKIRLLILLSLLAGKAVQAQVTDITGEWAMYEMIWTTGQDQNITTEEQLKDQGMKSEYNFMPDGTLKLVSNMTGSGNMEHVEGTWKLEGNKLTCTFMMGENTADIVWDFSSEGNAIHLKRNSPDGSTSVVNSFRRKEL